MAPIVASRISGSFVALCDRCRRPTPEEIDAPTREAARAQLLARGWMECAVLRGWRLHCTWRCPACAPRLP